MTSVHLSSEGSGYFFINKSYAKDDWYGQASRGSQKTGKSSTIAVPYCLRQRPQPSRTTQSRKSTSAAKYNSNGIVKACGNKDINDRPYFILKTRDAQHGHTAAYQKVCLDELSDLSWDLKLSSPIPAPSVGTENQHVYRSTSILRSEPEPVSTLACVTRHQSRKAGSISCRRQISHRLTAVWLGVCTSNRLKKTGSIGATLYRTKQIRLVHLALLLLLSQYWKLKLQNRSPWPTNSAHGLWNSFAEATDHVKHYRSTFFAFTGTTDNFIRPPLTRPLIRVIGLVAGVTRQSHALDPGSQVRNLQIAIPPVSILKTQIHEVFPDALSQAKWRLWLARVFRQIFRPRNRKVSSRKIGGKSARLWQNDAEQQNSGNEDGLLERDEQRLQPSTISFGKVFGFLHISSSLRRLKELDPGPSPYQGCRDTRIGPPHRAFIGVIIATRYVLQRNLRSERHFEVYAAKGLHDTVLRHGYDLRYQLTAIDVFDNESDDGSGISDKE